MTGENGASRAGGAAGDRLAIHVFTRAGLELARGIARSMAADIFMPGALGEEAGAGGFSSLSGHMERVFHAYRRHLFVSAAGIAVRAIAPLLRGKGIDPAVVVTDQRGAYVVSLLGGHMAGANLLARDIARLCGGQAVVSTATDVEGLPAIDALARECGLAIGDLEAAKAVNAAILRGERVSLSDPEERLDLQGHDDCFASARDPEAADVRVSWKATPASAKGLALYPRVLFAGVGCRKGVAAEQVLDALALAFSRHGLALQALGGIASVDIKAGEAGLTEAAARLGVPFAVYGARRLGAAGALSFSPKAWEVLGLAGVAEPAALCMAADRGAAMLLAPKMKHGNVTVAVARLGALWKKP